MTMRNAINICKSKGCHFFDNATMQFWQSKVFYDSFQRNNCFVTSEPDWDGEDRRFTVRRFTKDYSDVRTVGEFRQYATYQEALKVAKEVV